MVCRRADGHWTCGHGYRRRRLANHPPYCRSKRDNNDPVSELQPLLVVGATQATTRSEFVCVNLDYWPDAKQCTASCDDSDEGCCPWRGASLLDTPLSALEPAIRALSASGPLLVRLGGSLQDATRYADTESGCGGFVPDRTRRVGFSGGCLSVPRWLELHHMCRRAGCRLLFGINALQGRIRASNPQCASVGDISEARRRGQGRTFAEQAVLHACSQWEGEWDPAETALLLRALRDAGTNASATLAALSFGNEINGERGLEAHLTPEVYARGLNALHRLLSALWPRPQERPLLVAADGNWHSGWYSELVSRAERLDAVSYHHCAQPPHDPRARDSGCPAACDGRARVAAQTTRAAGSSTCSTAFAPPSGSHRATRPH